MSTDAHATLRPLPWHDALWLDVTALHLQQRLGHALLLAGPRGVGKRHFARALSAFLLCEQPSGYACGRCRSCEQFLAGTHANASLLCTDGHLALAGTASGRHELAHVHWQPDKDSKRRDIAIDAVRSLIELLGLTGHYGRGKVALIDPADQLNPAGVNALLKTVEEPPAATHLLLISERPQALLPTLRSRCQRLRFSTPPAEPALAWLRAAKVPHAEAALAEAQGAPLLAAEMAESGVLQRRSDWQSLWMAVAQRKRDPVSAAADVGKDDLADMLDWLMAWLTGLLRQSTAGAAPLPVLTASAAADMLREAADGRRRLAGNAQAQLLLESLLVQWAGLTRGAR